MAEASSPARRPRRLRLQFSLASVFLLMTLAAVGTWYWYQVPYAVENKQYATSPNRVAGRLISDPFAAEAPFEQRLIRRDVEYVRRVWGGKTVRHGPRRVYGAKGNLRREEHYRNGERHGEFVIYDSEGNRESLVTYDRGEKHGPSRRWNTQGVLLADENYNRGLRDGPFVFRHPEGKVAAEGAFDLGVPTGTWHWYPVATNRVGEPTHGDIVGYWRSGRPDGRWEWRDADGELYLAAIFSEGNVVEAESETINAAMLKRLAKAAGDEPWLLVPLFKSVDFDLLNVPLKDAYTKAQEAAGLPMAFHGRDVEEEGIPIDAPVTWQVQNKPLLLALQELLRPLDLTCHYRYGVLWIDTDASAASWEDKTGVPQLVPPRGSALAREWNSPTEIDFIEMPFKDVVTFLMDRHNVGIAVSVQPPKGMPPGSPSILNAPITLTLKGLSFQNCLAIVLSQLDLKAALQGETIVIEPQQPQLVERFAPRQR